MIHEIYMPSSLANNLFPSSLFLLYYHKFVFISIIGNKTDENGNDAIHENALFPCYEIHENGHDAKQTLHYHSKLFSNI